MVSAERLVWKVWLQHEEVTVCVNFIEMRGTLHYGQVMVYGNRFFVVVQ